MKYERSQFNYEECARRCHQDATLSLLKVSEGELNYLVEIAALWKASSHPAIRSVGETLAAAVDAEQARLEWKWHAEQAMFDAIAAEERPVPEVVDTSQFPKRSELPPEPFPAVPDHE